MRNKSLGRVGEVRGAKKSGCAAACCWGPLGTLLLLDAATCTAVTTLRQVATMTITLTQMVYQVVSRGGMVLYN